MFFTSGIVILAFVIAGITAGIVVDEDVLDARSWGWITGIGEYFGWLYVIAATFYVIFVLFLLFSRYGLIKLGPDDSKPEFGTMAWFAMLFTAGMGIGLVFFGVAEPTGYLESVIVEGANNPDEQAALAMSATLFHWGFHPWSIYIILGLALGYFSYRKGLPLRPASAFYPLIGDRIYKWPGHMVDILAVFGTMFGLATSLGLGSGQINAGLNAVFGVPSSMPLQIGIIAVITVVALYSVLAGIDKGIRRLSVLNMWLAIALLIIVFIFGPKLFMVNGMADWTGAFLQSLPERSLSVVTPSMNPDLAEWQANWTFFYWGWWISWAPFVGMFIARISYGRTIRQFITGVLFAPIGVTIVWFAVFGGSGMFYDLTEDAGIGSADSDRAMYQLLESLPMHDVVFLATAVLTILVVAFFFITSSDSGSLVIDILTNGGDPNPSKVQRAFWAILEGVVAAVLVAAGGAAALQTLQAASLTTGVPFAIVLVLVAFGLLKALRQENVGALQLRAAGLPAPSTGHETGPGGPDKENLESGKGVAT
ncbi:BCCT family transporter [Spiractinospora alimapuensis]|uniref:BCCT family transporter n=1 Tax=Spiractinospora alimapuensis TaxID=2820884 RepID=UPI001F1B2082|nr:BCCT family transporter [Spiractinospora alimapuensis]